MLRQKGRLVKDKGLQVDLICLGQREGKRWWELDLGLSSGRSVRMYGKEENRVWFGFNFFSGAQVWRGKDTAALDSKRLLLQCLDMSLLTHSQTPVLVKNTPKLRTVVSQSKPECSFSSH